MAIYYTQTHTHIDIKLHTHINCSYTYTQIIKYYITGFSWSEETTEEVGIIGGRYNST